MELQCALPTETVDWYSSAAWNQFLRFWTEIARTRDQVERLFRYTAHFHSQWWTCLREGKERALVVISSAGGVYQGEGSELVQDFLNPYLRFAVCFCNQMNLNRIYCRQMFRMMGFDRFEEIFIQGTAGRERKEKVEWTVKEARRVARILNQL